MKAALLLHPVAVKSIGDDHDGIFSTGKLGGGAGSSALTAAVHSNLIVFMAGYFGQSIVQKIFPKYFRPIQYFTRVARQRTGGRVHSGVFRGMHYVNDAVASAYLPKLLGIYERELAPMIEEACARQPRLIVDIGAAEGYYAVGLALRNPEAKVIAFEMQSQGRALVAEMARLNEVVNRVDIREKCEPEDLLAALGEEFRPFVVCDVEGYEEKLLDPVAVPSLKSAIILVEMHDHLCPGISEELRRRFSPSHRIECIEQQPRSHTEYPWPTLVGALLPKYFLQNRVDEIRRVRMTWLWMTPRDLS